MIFESAMQYEVFRMLAVDAVRGNEVIGKELHTHNIISDFDFYVDLYTALAGQQDDFSQTNTRTIIDAALRMGFLMGRCYGITIPEDIQKPAAPRRSRRTKRKSTPKAEAPKEEASHEE